MTRKVRTPTGPRIGLGATLLVLFLLSALPAGGQSGTIHVGPDATSAGADLAENFSAYMDYYSMEEYLQNLVAMHPDISSLTSLGRTYEGREIWCVKVSDDVGQEDDGGEQVEPDVLLVGAHHGNEWISYEVPLFVLSFLLENYERPGSNGSMATNIVRNRELYIVPMLNADGVQYSHDTGDMSRKNREPNYIGDFFPADVTPPHARPASYGVDINRNYGWMWHLAQGSNAINHNGGSYRGPPDNRDDDGDARIPIDWRPGYTRIGPEDGFDEDPWDGIDNDGDGEIDEDPAGGFTSAETRAMKAIGDEMSFPVLITYHSFSELVLWPWGWTDEAAPDAPLLTTLGTRLAEFNGYQPMQGYDLYMTSGEMTDWFYAQYGTLGYTFEIGRTFRPEESMILSECERNLEATLYLAHAASNPNESYIRFGPESSSLNAIGASVEFVLTFEDSGYPMAFDTGRCEVVYSIGGGRMRSAPLEEVSDGHWSATVVSSDLGGDFGYYYRLVDMQGDEVTYPVYAPEMLLVSGLSDGSDMGSLFNIGTWLVMLFTLGSIWGGFAGGIVKAMRSGSKV